MSDWKNVQYKDGKLRTSEGGGGGGSSTFAGLDDVSFSNLQNGQIAKYNSTTQKWENANESGGGHTYSTTEQVIGTWIDGKPIYEKTIVWNDTTAKAYVRKDIHDLNIDTLVSITGFFNRLESNNKVYWYPFNSMEASSEYGFYRIDNENGYANGQILWRINYNNTNTQRFIFTYTKTTDV